MMNLQFVFHAGAAESEAVRVNALTAYSSAQGYGFTEHPGLPTNEELEASWPGEYFIQPIPTFVVDAPYGSYVVTVILGSLEAPSSTVVKAGRGHAVLGAIDTAAGELKKESFAVHVDDGRLKLAFGGEAPCIHELHIRKAPELPILFLAGDSTVTDQPASGYPYTGWGQMLAEHLSDGIAVWNHARSGRSTRSFLAETRWNRLMRHMRAGDCLLIQFAHNDEKEDERGTEPFSTYKENLKLYIDGARKIGAHPVLSAPMHRRFFDEAGQITNTHGSYIEAMRQVAEEERVPFINLAAASKRLYEELGEERTKDIFMWSEPGEYATLPEGTQDNTHFSERGGRAIAGLVAGCIRSGKLEPLYSFLRMK